MKAEIFDKLGMADTAADDARDVVPGRASGYSLIGGARASSATPTSPT